MKTITSAEFRKTYPRITEPVAVTANGHLIGTWDPRVLTHDGEVLQPRVYDDGQGGRIRRSAIFDYPAKTVGQQRERDAILRRINKGQ